MNMNSDVLPYTELPEDTKQQLLIIIKKSAVGANLTSGEAAMLFHWKRHENDPAYDFVPEEYRGYK